MSQELQEDIKSPENLQEDIKSPDLQECIKNVIAPIEEQEQQQRWWSHIVKSKSGPPDRYLYLKQIAFGGSSGWCTGFLLQKYGRVTATAVGGGFLLLQVAKWNGYVHVDWKQVQADVSKVGPELRSYVDDKDTIVITTGFVGGFLLGLSS